MGLSLTKSQMLEGGPNTVGHLIYLTLTFEETGNSSTETSIPPGSRMAFPGVPSGTYAIECF